MSKAILLTISLWVTICAPICEAGSAQWPAGGSSSESSIGFVHSAGMASKHTPPQSRVSEAWLDCEEVETTQGILEYISPPDLTICFCGSYYLRAEKNFKDYYLLSDSVELSQLVGKRILVIGTPIVRPCEGTLLRECDFLLAETITPLTDSILSWGLLKAMYR